mmetsp:Transcript_43915/g.98791  ORF Transcript_43915/g.98791 Transcript_43915/m.98791 type:complete len:180 (+) Transcript_43915:454-993(+)
MCRFTVVLSQVPPGWCDDNIATLLCNEGFRDQFDFVHVTHDFLAEYGVVAVINFKSGVAANGFHSRFHGRFLESQMVLVDAAGIQGLRANKAYYQSGIRGSNSQAGRRGVYEFGSVKHRNVGKGGKRKGGTRFSHDSRRWQSEAAVPQQLLAHNLSNSVPAMWGSGRALHAGSLFAGQQ